MGTKERESQEEVTKEIAEEAEETVTVEEGAEDVQGDESAEETGVPEAAGEEQETQAEEKSKETEEPEEKEVTEAAAAAGDAEDAEETQKAQKAEDAEKAKKAKKAQKTKKAEDAEKAEDADEEAPAELTKEEALREAALKSGLPMRWYVVHTYSGHENKVKENIYKMIKSSKIGDHFSQIIVPTEEVAEMKKGKKTVTTRKFFPSYILIEMHMTDESRHLVSDMPGVTSFVGTASGPQPLSEAEVERILGRMDKEKQTIIPEIPFTLGEHIRIKDGPFSDFTGVIDEINADRGKLKVLVSIFGRETPVELDFLQVENL